MSNIAYPSNHHQESPEDPLLPHVPARQRGPIKNAFLSHVRAGITDPIVIRNEALKELQGRLRSQVHYRSPAETLDLRQAISAIMSHPSEAIAFANACIAYEQLPAEERARRKDVRGEAARQAWMAQQPVTDKQH